MRDNNYLVKASVRGHVNVTWRKGSLTFEEKPPVLELKNAGWNKIFSSQVQRCIIRKLEECEEELQQFEFSDKSVKVLRMEEDELQVWIACNHRTYNMHLKYTRMYDAVREEAILNSPTVDVELISTNTEAFERRENLLKTE